MTLSLAWFATARGATSGKLLAAAQDEIAAGRLDARIAVVFCMESNCASSGNFATASPSRSFA